MDRTGWPRPARELAAHVDVAVTASGAGDRESFDESVALLARSDREQVAVLLGTATVDLLERAQPDGLDAESAERLLAATLTQARPWFGEVDDDLLLQAMTGALGIGGHEDAPRADPAALLAHGLLLVGQLVRATGSRSAEVIDAAMAELIRAQTVEMP